MAHAKVVDYGGEYVFGVEYYVNIAVFHTMKTVADHIHIGDYFEINVKRFGELKTDRHSDQMKASMLLSMDQQRRGYAANTLQG